MSNNKILVVGCGGLLRQIYPHIRNEIINDNIVFLDEINTPITLYGCRFIRSFGEITKDITHFIIAVSNPENRKKLTNKCLEKGLISTNVIADDINLTYSSKISDNVIILRKTLIEEEVNIGQGVLINTNVGVHHNVRIGEFSEICPGVTLLGGCEIGSNTFIGCGSIIFPKVKIGDGVTIGAGSIIRGDIGDKLMVYTESNITTRFNL